jgi:hypothetical protein
MVTVLALVAVAFAAAANAAYPPDVQQMKDDYFIKSTRPTSQRLAGWQVLRPNNVKCDMVRRNIKKFGYCYQDENEKKGINTQKERGWVREVIQQWEKCGGVQFVEESKCRTGPDFVTVQVGNYGPVLYPQMDPKSCRIDGFHMLLDFYTFGVNIESYAKTEKIRKSNIQMYALHEFGHFLGFDHEQNRLDREECYYQIDAGEVGPDAIWSNYPISKEYDLESIMNYCRPNVHYKPYLSMLDKRAVWQAYGGGNWQECEAVTKPWKWGPNDGLDPSTLQSLNKERANNDTTVATGGEKPQQECADHAEKSICEERIESCKDEAMKYWCPKTCNLC